jgi:hypothetical protein
MFERIFFWRRKPSPQTEAETERKMNMLAEPRTQDPRVEATEPPDRRPVLLPAKARAFHRGPSTDLGDKTRVDYFTPGNYAAAAPGSPRLKSPAIVVDAKRRGRILSRAAESGT